MAHYSVQLRDGIVQLRDGTFVKGYGYLSFAKDMGKNLGKNINKNLYGKYSQNLLGYAKSSATDALKTTAKKAIQQTSEEACDLVSNKIADKILKVSKNSPHNNSETVTNKHDKKNPTGKYISSEERQKIIDDLRLI